MAAESPDEGVGLIQKYYVQRTDGDPRNKHESCRYFVLDPKHDQRAVAAIVKYADMARLDGDKKLADDLMDWVCDLQLLQEAERMTEKLKMLERISRDTED